MGKFKTLSLFIAGCAVSTYIYARYIEPNNLTVENKTIYTTKIEKDREIKIAQFSDLHLGEFTSIEMLNKVKEQINSLNADIIVFTGDMFDNTSNSGVDYSKVSYVLKDIKSTMGKYAVAGNHEHRHGALEIYNKVLAEGDFTLLVNQNLALDNQVVIVGIDDMYNGKGNVEISFKDVSNKSFNIVLCHEPNIADKIAEQNSDLIFSGHSHWGQVNLPFLSEIVYPPMADKYPKGEYNIKGKTLYTNPGIGTTKLPFRLFATPTIALYTIKGK